VEGTHDHARADCWTTVLEEQVLAICEWAQRACSTAPEDGQLWADFDGLLSGMVQRVVRSVHAEAAILSVETGDIREPRVYTVGAATADAPRVSLPVASHRDYGHLTIRFGAGRQPGEEYRRRLEVQATQLASVLDVAIALERAIGAGERAETLFDQVAVGSRLLESAIGRYEKLVMSFPGIVYLMELGEDGMPPRPVYVSPQIETLIGLPVEEWESDPGALMRVVHPEDRPIVIDNVKASERGDPARAFRMVTADGTSRWMQPQAINFEEEGRRYRQGLLLDITEAREVESERQRLESELRLAQKLEAVGELAAGIAHEINTPIQYVGDSLRFLSDAFLDSMNVLDSYEAWRGAVQAGEDPAEAVARVVDAEEQADLAYLRERLPDAFHRARDGIERVATIVRAMRRFSHPPSDAMSAADLNDALNNTLVVATNVYKYVADVQLDLGELPAVICDVGEINQVFLNLIVNAAHAIETVVGESGDRGTIAISTRAERDEVVIAIRDTGCGIPDDVAARVFDPFFTTKEVGRGSGQGLALARTIVVDRHRGMISFESRAGHGTTFVVRLPIREPAELAA
jgi:signal transduction histidine kinase